MLLGSTPHLSAKATWLGTVNNITATDPRGNKAVLMLDDPFTPIKELSSMPRKFELKLTAALMSTLAWIARCGVALRDQQTKSSSSDP